MAYVPTKKSDFDSRLADLLPDYSHAPPDTRIIELLRTNDPPTDLERQGLEVTLSQAPDHIRELDSLIHATTSLLRYLTKDRDQALQNQANAKKIIAPSRRLPPEMLTEIFLWCQALRGPRDTSLSLREVPWTLTYVCREWREVAIATRRIWSRIHLNLEYNPLHDENLARQTAFRLRLILNRAGPHDLSVDIEYDSETPAHPACVVLLSSVQYWKSLWVHGMLRDLSFLSPCRGRFDRLETATVWGFHHDGSELIDIFSVAPRLRSFTTTLNALFSLPDTLVVFRNLAWCGENTCTTLQGLVNLKLLSLSSNLHSSESPQIYLPRVSQLQLKLSYQNGGAAFGTYNRFDLPSLTHLRIWFASDQRILPLQVLNPIHSSTVTSLTLGAFLLLSRKPFTFDIERNLFPYCRLPNLQCLTVNGCSNINPFLRALSIHPGKNVIFPTMSALDIRCSQFSSFDDLLDMHLLVELVRSRIDQGALREFKVWWKVGLFNDDAGTRSRWRQLSAPGGRMHISASIKGL